MSNSRELLTAVSTYGRSGPSTRVRMLDWISAAGLEARIFDYLGTRDLSPNVFAANPLAVMRAERDLRRLTRERSDVLFLSRRASPFGQGSLERRLLGSANRSIYDFDDALWGRAPSSRRLLGDDGKKWRASVQTADVVIAGSEYLADNARAAGAAEVREIPSCVDPDEYQMRTDFGISEPGPTLVWFGSPSAEMYVRAITAPLLHLHRTRGARLVLVSAGNADLGELTPFTTRREWTPALIAELGALGDVAIAPLFDSVLARGKCAYKVLQYAAAGLPIVGSPIGANSKALGLFDALAPATEAEWTEALVAIVDEAESRRRERATTARKAVAQHYSFARWAPEWRNAVIG